MTLMSAKRRTALALLLWCVPSACGYAQKANPKTHIGNGLIEADVFLPDASAGFYRGTRFDWAGVIGNFQTLGHSFYGSWFTGTDPKVRDFEFRGSEIVAGPCSAITGPAEEFLGAQGGALGFDEAKPGGTFVKIGVGVLRRPDGAAYDPYRLYDIVDGGKWSVKRSPDAVELTQRVVDPVSGFGYSYRKAIRLKAGSREMRIEHSLLNLGRQPIDARVYDHNFLVLDGQTIGPAFEVTLPYTIKPLKPVDVSIGAVNGSTVLFRKPIEGEQRFSVSMGGFGDSPRDYHIVVTNKKAQVQLEIQGDVPLHTESIWAIRSTLAVEPFIRLSLPTGGTTNWSYTYRYSTLATAQP